MAVPSLGGSDAESEIQHLLADRLRALEMDVDLWRVDLDETLADPAFPGQEVERSEAWGLVGVSTGSNDGTPRDGVAIALQGHVDVVPAGDLTQWRSDPFTPYVDAGRVHGRGACDMKAGIVANLAAVRALRAADVRLDRSFALHFAIGEEDGGLGAFATLARGHRAESCVITEPTGRDHHHRRCRCPHVHRVGAGPGHPREHRLRRRQRPRCLPTPPSGPRGSGGAAQPRGPPPHGRVPDRLSPARRQAAVRRLGQLGAGPADRGGPDGGGPRRGPPGRAHRSGDGARGGGRPRSVAARPPADRDVDRGPVRQRDVRRRRQRPLRPRRAPRTPTPRAAPGPRSGPAPTARTNGSTRGSASPRCTTAPATSGSPTARRSPWPSTRSSTSPRRWCLRCSGGVRIPDARRPGRR